MIARAISYLREETICFYFYDLSKVHTCYFCYHLHNIANICRGDKTRLHWDSSALLSVSMLTVRHSWWNLFFSLMWASVTVAIAAFVRANGRMFCNRPRLHKPRRWWRYKIFSNRTIHLQVIDCFLHHFLSLNLVMAF